jgi:arabinose-5-phosphate isomerase
MLKEIFNNQRHFTDHFFDHLDLEPIEQLTQLLLNSKGMLFFTGVGKSGLVAKKIAYTMISTGTRAFYIAPTDALHGDLGMVSSGDTFIVLSKSGESEELLALAPAIRNKGAHLVGVLCNPLSRLASECHSTIHLPFENELCPFNMAPTTSTTVQLLFGDLLTVALMKHKKFTVDDYALNHPSGRIGKRMILRVKDLMLTGEKIPLCHPQDPLKNILVILSNKRCGCVLIVDQENQLLGIFTDGDLRRTLQKMGPQLLETPMEEVMNQDPQTITSDILAWEAMILMEADSQKRMMVLPVVDRAFKVEGLLLLHDIIQNGL